MLDNTFSLVTSFLDTEGMCPHDCLPLTEELCVLLSKSFLEIELIHLNPKSLPAAIPIRLITLFSLIVATNSTRSLKSKKTTTI